MSLISSSRPDLVGPPHGLFSRQRLKALIASGAITSTRPIEPTQIQPASLDLRLGKHAFRVRASFLPGRETNVRERLDSLCPERISLEGEGAVLEKGIVYVAPLLESLDLPPSLSGAANPKSSTGRLDIFTRLIVDGSEAFDDVPLIPLYQPFLNVAMRNNISGYRYWFHRQIDYRCLEKA